jgi:hypothetical protein
MSIAPIESASYNLSIVAAENKAAENYSIYSIQYLMLCNTTIKPIDNGDSKTSSSPPALQQQWLYSKGFQLCSIKITMGIDVGQLSIVNTPSATPNLPMMANENDLLLASFK